mgnify:CR=1 FL=1
MTVNTEAYLEFVNAVTSKPSQDHESFVYRIQELEGQGFPTERLLTASVGMCAEAGEFTEVVKKIIFQGKPVNEENLFHLKRELGDIMWYVAQATQSLGISMEEVLDTNIRKLSKRYPKGTFDSYFSENRAANDR